MMAKSFKEASVKPACNMMPIKIKSVAIVSVRLAA
jgi:hypothetical protein